MMSKWGHLSKMFRGDEIVCMSHTFGSREKAEAEQRQVHLREWCKTEGTGTKRKNILVLSEQGESKKDILPM